jgi:hypothetical protein
MHIQACNENSKTNEGSFAEQPGGARAATTQIRRRAFSNFASGG